MRLFAVLNQLCFLPIWLCYLLIWSFDAVICLWVLLFWLGNMLLWLYPLFIDGRLFLLRSLYSLLVYKCSSYALFLCVLSISSFNAFFWWTLCMCFLYVLFLCALRICYLIVHAQAMLITDKHGLWINGRSSKEVRFRNLSRKLHTGKDICRYCLQVFYSRFSKNLNNSSFIMLLRIAWSNLDHTFLERKMVPISFLFQRCYLKILIDDSFSVEEISELLCISERTLFRRMLKYDLHTIDVKLQSINLVLMFYQILTNSHFAVTLCWESF